jgi:hypothetical protein
VKDVDLLLRKAFEQLTELVELDGIVERLGTPGGRDAPDVDLDEILRELANVASGAMNRVSQLSHAVRQGGRLTGGGARWIVPFAVGAAAMAAAKNRIALARALEQAKDQGVGLAGDVRIPHHRPRLVAGGGTAGRSDPRTLRENLRIRAEHRERRRRLSSS